MNATSATISPTAPRRRTSTTRHTPLSVILNSASSTPRVSFESSTTVENPTVHAGTNLRELRDDRLNSVRALIESQLPTVKGIIETLAVEMIESTNLVRKYEARLVKWHEQTTENPYIPSSARITCPLTHSESLNDDIETLRLKREMEEFVTLFSVSASLTMKQMANREIEYVKEQKVKKFANLSVQLFECVTLHIIENEQIGESEQYAKDFKTFGVVILLHFIKTLVKDRIFSSYLPRREVVYTAICEELFEHMRDHDHKLKHPEPPLTDDEKKIRSEVEKAINPFFVKATYSLQMDLDEATEAKKHEATLAAYLKRQKIQAATSATQVAIDRQQALEGDPSLADNMESLMDKKINTLMEKQFKEYIPKHVTKVMKSWGRKNSSGGRHQPPTKPDGNTSNGHGSKKQPPAKNTANRKQNAKSTESTGKPKDTGKRKNQRKQSTSKSQPNSKQTPHPHVKNVHDSPGGKRNEGKEGNSRKRKRKQQKR
jgi:hypothetical protein